MVAVALETPVVPAAKELLRLVVVGSVDDGKSTLIGRLLYETGGLFEDQIASVERASAKGELDFSFFTDGLKAEREQGITIDVAYRYFSTQHRKVIVADTPGHVQYTRNMATGASTADAAVILVDARLGILPQTRRHAYIASLLGIPYLAVAINKMDLVDFSSAVFARLSSEVEGFAKAMGFEQVRSFPVSASKGDNITSSSLKTPWHNGGTLLNWLETLPHQRRLEGASLRFPVQYVIRPNLDYRGFAGQIASGTVTVGDEIVVLPSGRRSRISGIDTFDGALQQASAPSSVTLRLADEVDVSRGDLLAHVDTAPKALHRLEAHLVWFGEKPLQPGQRFLVKHTTRHTTGHVEQVVFRRELEDLSESPATSLSYNEIGKVVLVCKRPLLSDPYRNNRHTGAFILVDPLTHDTAGAGMIIGAAGGETQSRSLVSPHERRMRLGQPGCIIVLPHTATENEVFSLERALFDSGTHVATARGDVDVALGLAEAGLVALVHARSAQADAAIRQELQHAGVPWATATELKTAQLFIASLEKHQ